jgi:hypothetical protein
MYGYGDIYEQDIHPPGQSVYDRYCFRHEGNYLKDYCPSCFRDALLERAPDRRKQ